MKRLGPCFEGLPWGWRGKADLAVHCSWRCDGEPRKGGRSLPVGSAHISSNHLSCVLKDELGVLQIENGRGRYPRKEELFALAKV